MGAIQEKQEITLLPAVPSLGLWCVCMKGPRWPSRPMCGLFTACFSFINKSSTVLTKQATTENPHPWKWQFGSFLQMWSEMQLLTVPCREWSDVCHPSSKPFALPAQGHNFLLLGIIPGWLTMHPFPVYPFSKYDFIFIFFILNINIISNSLY